MFSIIHRQIEPKIAPTTAQHMVDVVSFPVMPSILSSAEYTLTVQRSRFCAVSVVAGNLEEIKAVVAARERSMRKARHHCWAFRGAGRDGQLMEQARDDGEVGRPGMVLLKLLRRYDLTGGLLVSRFFGGVKLGPGGVSRAFREAGAGVLGALGYDARKEG